MNYEEAWNNWKKIGPLALFHREADEVVEEESKLCEEFKEKHFGNVKFSSEEGKEKLVEMYGDLMFAAPADMAARLIASHPSSAPVYHYLYAHEGPVSLYDFMTFKPWKLLLSLFTIKLFGVNLFQSKSGICHA